MALEETTSSMTTAGTNWGIVIFFLILFWVFTGGFGGIGNNAQSADMVSMLQSEGAMGRVKNFDLERQNEQNTNTITQAIHSMQDNIAAAISAGNSELASQSRLQYDAQQGAEMFDLKLNTLAQQQSYETKMALQQQNYEAQLAAKNATIERMQLAENMTAQFNSLQAQITALGANMLTKPQITGVGAVCPNSGIINGLGIGSSLGCGYANMGGVV